MQEVFPSCCVVAHHGQSSPPGSVKLLCPLRSEQLSRAISQEYILYLGNKKDHEN